MRASQILLLIVIFVMALTITLTAGVKQGYADASVSDVRNAALQSCPDVEEEIVDLEVLATGLKSSKAVGVIDKIRLKSGIDGLLKRMRDYHDGKRTYSLDELQEQYDVLLMKIASHLQDKDVIMHGQLCNAWEVLWLDLEDSDRFAEKFL